MKRTTIWVTSSTKAALDLIKHPGQSYDGLLQELMASWKKTHGQKEEKGTEAQ